MRLAALIPALLFGSSLSFAQPRDLNLAIHNYPSDHFSISVPSGWVDMPKAELDRITTAARKAAPKYVSEPFKYGFLESAGSPFPRVVILMRSGRWSEELIAQMPALAATKDEAQHNVTSSIPALAAMNLQIGKMSWDSKARIAWVPVGFSDERGQPMAGLAGLHPTELGVIQVNCYATQSDFERIAPTFVAIIASVKIDEAIKYRKRSALGTVTDSTLVPALFGGIFGIVLVLAIHGLRAWRHRVNEVVKPRTRESYLVGAAWKVALGVVLLLSQANTLLKALKGDGWLQSTAESAGYWGVWGLIISLALYAVCLGGRDALAARR
jgi:hypothetical protein